MASDDDVQLKHRRQLMWALQSLAAPAEVQKALYPAFVPTADELALDFDNWRRVAASSSAGEWSDAQRAALTAVDAKLTAMSLGEPEYTRDLWTDASLGSNQKWEQVRALATGALALFGWSAEVPPSAESRGLRYLR